MMKISSQVCIILLDHFTQDQPFFCFFIPDLILVAPDDPRHVNTSECSCGNTQQLLWVLVHQNTVDNRDNFTTHTVCKCPAETLPWLSWRNHLLCPGVGTFKRSRQLSVPSDLCVSVCLFACSCVFIFTNKLYYFLRDRMSAWPLEQAEYSRVKQWQTKTKSNLCT